MPFSLKLWGSCLKGEIHPPFGSLCLRILFLHDEYPADSRAARYESPNNFLLTLAQGLTTLGSPTGRDNRPSLGTYRTPEEFEAERPASKVQT
jgi:hypothetical protein